MWAAHFLAVRRTLAKAGGTLGTRFQIDGGGDDVVQLKTFLTDEATRPHEWVFWPGLSPNHAFHRTGRRLNGTGWQVTAGRDPREAYLTMGAEMTGCPTNRFLRHGANGWPPNAPMAAEFELGIDDRGGDGNVHIATVDVMMHVRSLKADEILPGKVLGFEYIKRGKFPFSLPRTHRFVVPFTAPESPTTLLEFRVYYKCCASLLHAATRVYVRDLPRTNRTEKLGNS